MMFKIKPCIISPDSLKFGTLISEIYQMPFSMIEDGIESCRRVMSGEYPEMSWGLEVSELLIHKETSTLEYHGKFVAEIPTVEIYNMLKAYRDKLKEYDNEKTNEIGITENEVLDTIKLNDNETPNPDDAIVINESIIKQSDIQEIIDAFQVASGQSYATKNTEKMLLMIEKYNGIEILKADNSIIKVSNAEELSDFILSIDEYVDLKKVNDLKRFFS